MAPAAGPPPVAVRGAEMNNASPPCQFSPHGEYINNATRRLPP